MTEIIDSLGWMAFGATIVAIIGMFFDEDALHTYIKGYWLPVAGAFCGSLVLAIMALALL